MKNRNSIRRNRIDKNTITHYVNNDENDTGHFGFLPDVYVEESKPRKKKPINLARVSILEKPYEP